MKNNVKPQSTETSRSQTRKTKAAARTGSKSKPGSISTASSVVTPKPAQPKNPAASTKAKKQASARKKSPAETKRATKPAKRSTRTKTRRAQRSKLTSNEVTELFARFQADTPEPKGDLEYTNPYTLLVAVALSAQATDVGVNKATRGLFNRADTPSKMLKLGEDKLREQIRTIGLFRNKAKNVIAMSQILVDDFNGDVPRTREELERLPGVGRKTANVVLNNAFGEPTIAVDTHLFRVSNRTGLAPGKDPLAVELGLLKVVPDTYLLHAHHWLILHGRYTCVARKPKCPVCIISPFCKFKDKTELN